MNAKELIGKRAIREKPMMYKEKVSGSGLTYFSVRESIVEMPDYALCTEPVKIINATDHHIVCERRSILGEARIQVLDERYCDDAWTDYDELIGGSENEHEE